jgi:hypothetical protein
MIKKSQPPLAPVAVMMIGLNLPKRENSAFMILWLYAKPKVKVLFQDRPFNKGVCMSFWDRIFMGRVVKDFGLLEEKSFLLGKMKKSLLLVDRRGKLKIVFKWSGIAPFGASVNYFDLKADSLPRLRECLDEIQSILNPQSPPRQFATKPEGIVPGR